ncbi:MAG TPA: hypothetical protein VII35_04560 [Steroidobacteraceae bacterium]
MIAGGHDDEAVARHLNERQRRVLDVSLRKTKIGRTVKYRRRDIGGIAFAEHHSDRWMRSREAHQEWRKPIAGDGLAGLNCKGSTLKTAEFGQRQFRKPRASLRRFRLDKKQPSRLAQLNAASNPMEKADPIASFQSVDRRAHRGRGEVQGLGGSREVLALGDGDKNPELIKGHC